MKSIEVREAVTLSQEGKKIFGVLHTPIGSHKAPVVLFCSGFGGNKSGKFRVFVRLSQELAKLGIASLRFDYRGAGDSEGDAEEVTVESQVNDALVCLKFLLEDSRIDPTRIGLLGRSFGGLVSLLTASKIGGVKGLALWAPVFDSTPWKSLWESFKLNQINATQKQEILNIPGGIPNVAFLMQFFKLDMANAVANLKHVPLLHIQADRDSVVKDEHADAYKKACLENAKTRFVRLPNSDHDFSDFTDQQTAIQETCDWFKHQL